MWFEGRHRLHGYSERGVVNAVFETIANHENGAALLEDLLDLLLPWDGRGGGELLTRRGRRLVDFDIYIEPSLSDFGNPDVLVFACYRDPVEGTEEWETFFIEAKMEPFLMSSPPTAEELSKTPTSTETKWNDPREATDYRELAGILTTCDFDPLEAANEVEELWRALVGHAIPTRAYYQTNASSLLHELFMKYRFWETHIHSSRGDRPTWADLKNGVRVYSGEKEDGRRKIGADPTVLRLVHRLRQQGVVAHFVSMTTDPPPAPDEVAAQRQWPLGMAVTRHLAEIYEWNNGPCNPWGMWCELACQLSWFDVRAWSARYQLRRVQQALDENEEKFRFWPRCACIPSGPQGKYQMSPQHEPLLEFLRQADPGATWNVTPRTRPWRASLCRNGVPILRMTPEAGFSNGYWLQVASDQDRARQTLAERGLPYCFRLPADAGWRLVPDSEGARCLRLVVETFRKAGATTDPLQRRQAR